MLNYYFQTNNRTSCCSDQQKEPPQAKQNAKLAQAYVPFQEFVELYTPEQALTQGTIFRQLDQPYKKRK